jgi:ribosome-associated heat shock protein Hsp15
MSEVDVSTAEGRTRIDKWLWAARFFKTRSLAADAIDSGKVLLNTERCKPARALRVGDELQIRTPGAQFTVLVVELSQQRGSAPQAARLYRETDESIKARVEERMSRHNVHPEANLKGRPTKRTRRQLYKVRGETL